MAVILKGSPAAARIDKDTEKNVTELLQIGVIPALAVFRMGEKADDIYYENAAEKKCGKLGVAFKRVVLPDTAGQKEAESALRQLCDDRTVHGILVLRPLPAHIDDEKIAAVLEPGKDVDGITPRSLAAVFSGQVEGFAPCTARACVEILKHYGIGISGKKTVVIGRSLVIGKPVSMLLLRENATVTICHTKTADVSAETKRADIIVTSTGKAESLIGDMVAAGQTVIDVGMNYGADGKMSGDTDFDKVSEIVSAITPVPGGVGSVTTSILVNNVTRAAINAANDQ